MSKPGIVVEVHRRLLKVCPDKEEVRIWMQHRDGDGSWSLVSDEELIKAAMWAALQEKVS